MAELKVLFLPSFYPDEINVNLGSFFREQVITLAEFGINVNVIYTEQRSLHHFSFLNLRKNHFQITVTNEAKWKEYRIKGWKIPGVIGRKIWIYLSERLIRKYITENGKPDLIHAHNIFWAGVVARNMMEKLAIPFIITEHDSAFLLKNISHKKQNIARQVYLKASKVIAVSKGLLMAMKGIEPKLKIDIIPNIVDTDFFKPAKKKQSCNNIIKFLAIGNLNKNKGHDLLIDSFFEVSKVNQNVRLKICGDGPEKKYLNEKIKALNLENKVKLTGHIAKSQILERLQESDCLVHTSYFETFGIVLIEALACGIPIITTKSGGPEDIFKKGFGYLINVGNRSELTKAMMDFLSKIESFSSNKLSNHIVESYSKSIIFQKLNNIYLKILER